MKKLLVSILLLVSFLTTSLSATALVHVNGYYRSNGTYVQPHYRTSPDSSIYNNFSYNGYRTTGMSYNQAYNLESYLKGYKTVSLSKREKKVVKCQSTGKSEKYCKSIYMPSKKHK